MTSSSRPLRLIGLVVLIAILGAGAYLAVGRYGPFKNVVRVDYRSFGQSASVIPTEVAKIGPGAGASVLGPSFQPSRPGARLRFRVVMSGLLSADNELVVVVFRQDEPRPVAVMSSGAAAGQRAVVDKTFGISTTTAAPLSFDVRVGLARPAGQVYINGGPNGPDTSWPASYVEISEER